MLAADRRSTSHPSRTAAVLAACVSLLATMFAAAPLARAQEVIDHGHVDAFFVTAPGGTLTLGMKEDVTGSAVERPGDDVILAVSDAAWSDATTTVADIGTPTYFLPQTQDQSLLWPGWDTQPAGAAGYETVDFHLARVDGPGAVYAFETQGFGELHAVTNSGSLQLTSGEVITQPYPAHRHVNWAFTEPGTYRMTVYAASGADTSNEVTYTWQVGSGAAAPADAAQGQTQPQGQAQGQAQGQPQDQAAPQDSAAPGAQHSQNRASTAGGLAPAQGRLGGSQSAPAAQSATTSGTGSTEAQCVPGLNPLVKDDTVSPAEWRPADGATFAVGDKARVDLPTDIGPVPKGQAWMIGSTQTKGVPWLGANTQHPDMRAHTRGPVHWQLVALHGPGPVMVYAQGGLGQIVGQEWFRADADGHVSGGVDIPENSHVHPNWVFGAPGTYELVLRQTATGTDGATLTGQATLRFEVGGSAPAGAFTDGHFDFGAAAVPGGGDCTGGAADTSGTTAAASTAGADTTAAAAGAVDTSASVRQVAAAQSHALAWGLGLLGLGSIVLGVALGLLARRIAKARA